jgi:hypothetical protein
VCVETSAVILEDLGGTARQLASSPRLLERSVDTITTSGRLRGLHQLWKLMTLERGSRPGEPTRLAPAGWVTQNGTRFENGFLGRRTAIDECGECRERLDEGSLSMKGQRQWEPMRVTYLGNVAEVVQQGGAKLSTTTGDPGEPRKVPSTG